MRRLSLFAIACVAIWTSACSREHVDVAKSGPPTSAPVTSTDVSQNNSTVVNPVPIEKDEPSSRASAPAPNVQEVQLMEYEIRMPETLRAGHITLHVANAGKENHGLVIEGGGIVEKTDTLSRGNTATLAVDLAPGTYTFYCPVRGHKGKGMERTITVVK